MLKNWVYKKFWGILFVKNVEKPRSGENDEHFLRSRKMQLKKYKTKFWKGWKISTLIHYL